MSGTISAKGGLSALINENSEQIKIIRSKTPNGKILEYFIMAIGYQQKNFVVSNTANVQVIVGFTITSIKITHTLALAN